MAIKRYLANADNTIVNTYKPDLKTRGTGSNNGYTDVMEVYSIYGRQASGSQELSRMLVQFPISDISTDRTSGVIPASGSVSYYLRLFNAQHSRTVPEDYKLTVNPLSQSWQEGTGLDLDTYKDETKGNIGSNWMSASNTSGWTNIAGEHLVGGSIITSSGDYLYEQLFETGLEDLEINITPLVESWIAGTIDNYGVLVKLSSSYEASASASDTASDPAVITNPDGATTSYYTKRFFARGSQYFFKRPVIEARWNYRVVDDRGNFYYSSSLAPAVENLNTLYLYNYVRGVLTDIPAIGTGEIYVDLYSGSSAPTGSALIQSVATPATGGYVSTGIYSCSVSLTAAATPLTRLFDVWRGPDASPTEYFTGSISPIIHYASQTSRKPVYYINITNNQGRYRSDETARFNLYIRNKYWNPTIYTVADTNPPTTTIESASYRVYRTIDGYEAIPYGTGSDLHTLLSHDVSGNYFDFDMGLLEPGYRYAFTFAFYEASIDCWSEQPQAFTFRVEEYEY
jgi:hypothetical protein